MTDRQPAPGQAGRVLITPEDQSVAPFYATIEMADNPIDPGTPINKATLLQDTTAALFGQGADATPNGIFSDIYNMLGERLILYTTSYTGTGEVGQSHPNSITFPYPPKFVLINDGRGYLDYGSFKWFPGNTSVSIGASSVFTNTVSLSGNTLSWYNSNVSSDDAANQLNAQGVEYLVFALLDEQGG